MIRFRCLSLLSRTVPVIRLPVPGNVRCEIYRYRRMDGAEVMVALHPSNPFNTYICTCLHPKYEQTHVQSTNTTPKGSFPLCTAIGYTSTTDNVLALHSVCMRAGAHLHATTCIQRSRLWQNPLGFGGPRRETKKRSLRPTVTSEARLGNSLLPINQYDEN
jgi:hypothetical protein